MKTLRQFATGQIAIPSVTAGYLSDLGEFRGKQEPYTRQSPQRRRRRGFARGDLAQRGVLQDHICGHACYVVSL